MRKLTFKEFDTFISYVVNECFMRDEESGKDIAYYPQFKDLSILEKIAEYHYDYVSSGDLEKDYDYYLDNILPKFDILLETSDDTVVKKQHEQIIKTIDERIEFRKSQMLNNSKSEISVIADKIVETIGIINSKLAVIDEKKLNKFLNKLNVDEIVKAYNRVGSGNKTRDNAISELAKENIELKNQISAKNVVADNVGIANSNNIVSINK